MRSEAEGKASGINLKTSAHTSSARHLRRKSNLAWDFAAALKPKACVLVPSFDAISCNIHYGITLDNSLDHRGGKPCSQYGLRARPQLQPRREHLAPCAT